MGGAFAIAAVAIAFAVASSAKGGGSVPLAEAPDRAGLNAIRSLGARAGLSEDWIAFFAMTARGESGWNNLVGLGDQALVPEGIKMNRSAAEATAARRAYERNVARYGDCPHPAWMYQFGSGGWFGILPANGLQAFWCTQFQCLSPYAVFEPEASLVMAIGIARRLQNWSGFQARPTWINLRLGWGCPSCMGDPERIAARRERFEGHARATGLPDGWLDRPVTPLGGGNLAQLLVALRGGATA